MKLFEITPAIFRHRTTLGDIVTRVTHVDPNGTRITHITIETDEKTQMMEKAREEPSRTVR